MRKVSSSPRIGLMSGASLLAVLLGACGKSVPTPDVPAPTAAPVESAPAPVNPAPPTASEAAAVAPVEPAVVVAQKAVIASAAEPELATMALAEGSSKMSVPVDLRYQFDGNVQTGQPATLHLAVVPRVAGTNLAVSIKKVSGVSAAASVLGSQKAVASTAYRQDVTVTKLANGPSELRVLVTMDLPEGSGFGWFSVPFSAPPATGKLQPVSQK